MNVSQIGFGAKAFYIHPDILNIPEDTPKKAFSYQLKQGALDAREQLLADSGNQDEFLLRPYFSNSPPHVGENVYLFQRLVGGGYAMKLTSDPIFTDQQTTTDWIVEQYEDMKNFATIDNSGAGGAFNEPKVIATGDATIEAPEVDHSGAQPDEEPTELRPGIGSKMLNLDNIPPQHRHFFE